MTWAIQGIASLAIMAQNNPARPTGHHWSKKVLTNFCLHLRQMLANFHNFSPLTLGKISATNASLMIRPHLDCVAITGGGRSSKVGQQEWGTVDRAPVGFRSKNPDGSLRDFTPKSWRYYFGENMMFCRGFKNDSDICIHYLQVCNMKWTKNQFEGRKVVGQATLLAYWAKKWAGDCPPCLIGSAANGHYTTVWNTPDIFWPTVVGQCRLDFLAPLCTSAQLHIVDQLEQLDHAIFRRTIHLPRSFVHRSSLTLALPGSGAQTIQKLSVAYKDVTIQRTWFDVCSCDWTTAVAVAEYKYIWRGNRTKSLSDFVQLES